MMRDSLLYTGKQVEKIHKNSSLVWHTYCTTNYRSTTEMQQIEMRLKLVIDLVHFLQQYFISMQENLSKNWFEFMPVLALILH